MTSHAAPGSCTDTYSPVTVGAPARPETTLTREGAQKLTCDPYPFVYVSRIFVNRSSESCGLDAIVRNRSQTF